jgi:hypothetical protein
MTWIMVDIESDGPVPGLYSMVSLGAVVVEPSLQRTFYAQFRPISDGWVPEALAVSGHTREECMEFPSPEKGMNEFASWLAKNGGNRPMFVSDNNGFDWMFVCWYFWKFTGGCPLGHSSTNLGSLYKGLVQDMSKNFKHLRKTRHSHHPVEDAKGNAEAMLHLKDELGLKIGW